MKLDIAQRIANRLVERLTPHCQRVEVAGSVRRRVPEVGDIELVAIPMTYQTKMERTQGDMFEDQYKLVQRSELVDGALVSLPNVIWVKTSYSVDELTSDGGQQTDIPDDVKLDLPAELSEDNMFGRNRKHWKGISSYNGQPFQIDLFLTQPDRFGATYLIRTGSAGFNQRLIPALKERGYGFVNGDFVRFQNAAREVVADIIYCPEELVIFKQLGLDVVPPEKRTGNLELKIKN